MKVLGIPVSDIDLGSTRTRYYYMLRNLPKEWEFERYKKGAKGDVLYIQKIETSEVWDAVRDCKKRGIPIVYDRDDFCKPWNTEHTKIMNAVDAVTIISKGLLDLVKDKTTTPMYHVFDGFDYDIQRSERAPIRDQIRKVTTYGRHANIEAVAPFYKEVKYKKTYFCDRPIKVVKQAKYIPWSLYKFKRKIIKHDLVIIVHANNFRKKYKDMGRVMVAMALGIPVIANSNIETKRVFREIGHPELAIKTPDDLKKAIKLIKPYAVRKKISDDMFDYAWKHWRPDQASARMAEIFTKVINEKNIY